MKLSFTLLATIGMFFSCNSLASDLNITENSEVLGCISNYGEENAECFSNLNEKTERKLILSFDSKLTQISNFDYEKWWMGSQEQKEDMISFFKKNQNEWKIYRNNYCQIASTAAENTHSYAGSMLSCIINMNKKRIDEINMINP